MAHGAQLTFHPSRASQRIGMAVAVALHAVAGTALLTYEPARSALLAVAPIMVSLVTPPKPEVKAEPTPAQAEACNPAAAASRPSRCRSSPRRSRRPRRRRSSCRHLPRRRRPNRLRSSSRRPRRSSPRRSSPRTTSTIPRRRIPRSSPRRRAGPRRAAGPGQPGRQGRRGRIRTSSGHRRLDESARDTVRRWRFVPAKRGDEPVVGVGSDPDAVSLEDERVRLVVPWDPVEVEDLRALEFAAVHEPGRLGSTDAWKTGLSSRTFTRVPIDSDSALLVE